MDKDGLFYRTIYLFLFRVLPCVSWAIGSARRSEDKKKTLRQQNRRSVSTFVWSRLADLRAQETAVVFYSHSAAAE
ncbi:MAG: hypothetical protein DME32_04040 [Verrucomicrobia bacterium]|nr:MAG: hypothetical protein DME32_04040 [Verrucomicrobiota bacterium]